MLGGYQAAAAQFRLSWHGQLEHAQRRNGRRWAGWFRTVDEEGAELAEGAELSGVAEPAAGVDLGDGSGIGDADVSDVCEASVAE